MYICIYIYMYVYILYIYIIVYIQYEVVFQNNQFSPRQFDELKKLATLRHARQVWHSIGLRKMKKNKKKSQGLGFKV